MTIPQPAAGWYADPVGYQRERYWDGSEWTGKVRTTDRTPTGHRSTGGYVGPQRYSPYGPARRETHRHRRYDGGSDYPPSSFGHPIRTSDDGIDPPSRRSHGYVPGPGWPAASTPGARVAQQLSLMPAALADAVSRELIAGSYLLASSPTSAVVGPRPVPHALHLVATILTGGLWSVVWVGHTVSQSHAVSLTLDPVRGVVRERVPFRRSPYAA